MRRSDITSRDGGWAGLLLEPERPARPALRIEVASGRRLVITQNGEPVLLARVDGHFYGIDYLRAGRFRSPLPPLRADEASRIHDLPGVPAARWAHRFARELTGRTAQGPLHAGRWAIRTGLGVGAGPPTRRDWDDLLRPEHPDGYLDWFSSGPDAVIPLRELSGATDGRVSAYRRQVRAAVLPPVLLWWISGLNAYVVVDGHDRLTAALAEGLAPPLLVLFRVRDRPIRADSSLEEYGRQVASLEREVRRGTPGAAQALSALHHTWARTFDDLADGPAPTRAWSMPGGRTAWARLAAAYGGETRCWL